MLLIHQDPIKTHDKPHCTFRPELPDDPVRSQVSSSGYGPDKVQHKIITAPEKPALPPNPDETFKPKLVQSEMSATLRKIVPSSGYGRRTALPRVVTPKNPAVTNSRPVLPTPVGNPHEKMPRRLKAARRLSAETQSSGYACVLTGGPEYRPGLAKRGELAEKDVELPATRRPSFQPELFLSKAAKQMKETIPGRRLKPRTGHPGYAQDMMDSVNLDDVYSGRFDLMKSPERDLADKETLPYSEGFILDGVATANRQVGNSGNKTMAMTSSVKAGYVGSPIEMVPHADHRHGEPDVY